MSLFNGRDLTGWGYRPTSEADRRTPRGGRPATRTPPRGRSSRAVSFDGQTATPDGRYVAKNGRLVVTTPPEGRKIQQLWTTREFPKDFILKLEFRATPNADSGVFIRGPQLQCRDYLLAGPYKDLEELQAAGLERDGGDRARTAWPTARATAKCWKPRCKVPATGPIGLEGDRGQMEYRRIRIKVLPR